LGGAVTSSPTIVDGVCYVGSYDKNIYALDAVSGDIIWKFTTDYNVMSSPAVVEGKLYTGADDGNIYCLNAETGTQMWKYHVGGPIARGYSRVQMVIRSSPTVVWGKVYVGHLDGNMYCINAYTGDLIWSRQTGGQIMGSPALVANDGLYINSNTPGTNGTLYKLDATSGDIIWTLSIPYGGTAVSDYSPNYLYWYASPTVADGKVFIPADSRDQYCINAANGDIIWKVVFNAEEESLVPNVASMIYDPGMPYWKQTGNITFLGEIVPKYELFPATGKVYTMDSFFSVLCLDASNGEVLWKSWLGREVYGISYALNKVYANRVEKAVYVLDADTGKKLSYWELESNCWSSPSLWDNKMYLTDNGWYVYCWEEADCGGTTYYGS
jgi:outer membrane protein assembly factor BamB